MYYKVNPKIDPSNISTEHILKQRGIEDIQTFLHPTEDLLLPYNLLDNIQDAAALLYHHIIEKNKIYIVVDCDNDGVTSAAMLWNYIKDIRPDANLYFTMHDGKQHGVELDKVEPDTKLVIIPDAGSNQYEELAELRRQDIDVIVLDHHESEYYSPDAFVVNNQLSLNYPNKSLSGAGVVYKFLQCMDDLLKVTFPESLARANDYLDLAAVGIIGDMMDLVDLETRYIVDYGLTHIKNPGLKIWIQNLAYQLNNATDLTPSTVSFYVTPTINGIIRVGTMEDKETLFLCFIDGNKELPSTKRGAKPGDVELAASKAFRLGTNAKNRQKKIVENSIALLQSNILNNDLLNNKILLIQLDEDEADSIDGPMTGYLAMKIMKEYNKPTIIVRPADGGVLKGSLRGDNTWELDDFKQFLKESGLMEYVEGHGNAAGAGIKPKNVQALLDYANEKLANTDFNDTFYMVDYSFTEADIPALKQLIPDVDKLKTAWGKSVEEPWIAIKLSYTLDNISVMGKKMDTSKIVKQGLTFIRFNDSNFADLISKYDYGTITIVGTMQMNEFNGRSTPQVTIKDYQIEDDRYSF